MIFGLIKSYIWICFCLPVLSLYNFFKIFNAHLYQLFFLLQILANCLSLWIDQIDFRAFVTLFNNLFFQKVLVADIFWEVFDKKNQIFGARHPLKINTFWYRRSTEKGFNRMIPNGYQYRKLSHTLLLHQNFEQICASWKKLRSTKWWSDAISKIILLKHGKKINF